MKDELGLRIAVALEQLLAIEQRKEARRQPKEVDPAHLQAQAEMTAKRIVETELRIRRDILMRLQRIDGGPVTANYLCEGVTGGRAQKLQALKALADLGIVRQVGSLRHWELVPSVDRPTQDSEES